jgi:hypothetical protein
MPFIEAEIKIHPFYIPRFCALHVFKHFDCLKVKQRCHIKQFQVIAKKKNCFLMKCEIANELRASHGSVSAFRSTALATLLIVHGKKMSRTVITSRLEKIST